MCPYYIMVIKLSPYNYILTPSLNVVVVLGTLTQSSFMLILTTDIALHYNKR